MARLGSDAGQLFVTGQPVCFRWTYPEMTTSTWDWLRAMDVSDATVADRPDV